MTGKQWNDSRKRCTNLPQFGVHKAPQRYLPLIADFESRQFLDSAVYLTTSRFGLRFSSNATIRDHTVFVEYFADIVVMLAHLGVERLLRGVNMILVHSKSRLVGYARVSTTEQELNLQTDALLQHGVKKELLFCDKISGAKEERPGLTACNEILQRGDTLVVWRLDRLGRSMRHLVNMIEDLKERGIGFRSISDGMIDTTSASGELVLNIFSALAQFERRLIQERTNAGLAAARARGRIGGRPAMDRNHPKVKLANKLFCDKTIELDDICETLKISRSTLYRYVTMCGNRDVR